MRRAKRSLAMLLAIILCVALLPVQAMAAELEDAVEITVGEPEEAAAAAAEEDVAEPAEAENEAAAIEFEGGVLTEETEDTAEMVESGTCGDGFTWQYENYQVIIKGTGELTYDFSEDSAWNSIAGSMEKIYISTGITDIDCYFGECPNVKVFSIPSSVENASYYVFNSFSALEKFQVDSTNTWFKTIDGCLYLERGGYGKWLYRFPAGMRVSAYAVPADANQICPFAFYGSNYLEAVTVPEGITYINPGTFAECGRLKAVELPTSLTEIASNNAFDADTTIDVYYRGTQAQWSTVKTNGHLTSAKLHYGQGMPSAWVYPESAHPYANYFYDDWTYTAEGASALKVSFSTESCLADDGYDNVSVLAGAPEDGDFICDYYGSSIAGQTVEVPGDTVTVTLMTDGSGTAYGFKVTDIEAVYKPVTPVIKSVKNTANGLTVKWDAVPGADSYRIYVDAGSGFGIRTVVFEPSYTDTSANSGQKYSYKIVAVIGAETSEKSAPKSAYRIETTTVSSVKNAADGLTVTWGKVTGAGSYAIYRSKDGGTYGKVTTVTGTSYTDTAATAGGAKYSYKVYAISHEYWSVASNIKSAYRVAAPTISSVKNAASGLTVSWGKVTGATSYAIYRSENGGSYSKVTTVTGTSYTDTKATTGGSKYSYKVYAISHDYWSVASNVKSAYRVAAPAISSVKNAASGITVTWGKVTGAGSYAIYRSKDGGTYSKVTTVTGTSYTDTAATTGGSKYSYKVYAISHEYWSVASNIKSAYRVAAPAISSVKQVSSGVTVSWGKVTGAGSYAIYRSVNGGTYGKVTTVTGTSYTDTGATTKGTQYSYKVYAISHEYWSVASAAKSITRS